MAAVLDFLRSALPWISIGLFLIIFVTKNGIEKTDLGEERDAATEVYKKMAPTPSIIMVVLAVLELIDGNTSGASTWFTLAVVFFVLSIYNQPGQKKK